ncbi:MAG TPA: UDP-N-acetylmuramate--L-alanine ligase, partial [Bacteroidales bacterium]
DRTESALTKELVKEGMIIHYADDISLIEERYKNSSDTLVVFTPAVSSDHSELTFFRNNGFQVKKRAEVLGIISRSNDVLAVAGTHGKTTTSTMISHLLKSSDLDCSAFLGGISLNYNNNLLLSAKSKFVVVEADEYDRSFLQLNPRAAIITSMDADHLDIYGTYDEYRKAFTQFASQIKPHGFLVIKKGLEIGQLHLDTKLFTYSLDKKADFYAKNITIQDGAYHYDVVTPKGTLHDIKLGFPGLLNVENSVAAIAMASLLDTDEDAIRKAMESFRGVKRRFEYHIKNEKLIFIDDYGHHPEELRFTIESVKKMFPGKRITGIFQPHLYTRTRDLADDFARSLSLLDELILLDIYPAREKPIPGVSSEMVIEKVNIKEKHLCPKEELVKMTENMTFPEVLISMGAGDIDTFVEPIKQVLLKRLQSMR